MACVRRNSLIIRCHVLMRRLRLLKVRDTARQSIWYALHGLYEQQLASHLTTRLYKASLDK